MECRNLLGIGNIFMSEGGALKIIDILGFHICDGIKGKLLSSQ
jgi:hypothetical protein